jgi:photosystem II stability/assembly factor-like uncharacterized protein
VAMTRRTMAAWCAAALAAALASGCASVSASGGTVAGTGNPSTSGPAQGFWPVSLDMTSATAGWALYAAQSPAGTSSQPTLLARTVDGARNWTDVTPAAARTMLATTFASQALDPVDSEHAYLAVSPATQDTSPGPAPAAVFATTDGGRTWTESAPFTVDGPVIQVTFADPRHGWLLADGGHSATGAPLPWFYRTTDGGLHWTQAATAPPPGEGGPNDMCNLLGIAFPTATTGWVRVGCRSGEYLAESTDGGGTWAVQSLPTSSTCAMPVAQCELFGPELSDGTAYLTVTPTTTSSPSLFASGDLGRSWHQLPLPADAEQYPQVTFFGSDDGLLVPTASQEALGTVFYTTTDGGQTWSPVPQGTHFTQLGAAIDFITAQDGFSWTQAGYAQGSTPPPLYATTNSGATWTSFTPEVAG